MKNTPKVQAAIAIIRTGAPGNYEYLLIERATHPNDYWSGHLSFPGGKVEPNESTLETAIRECFEEVGVTLSKSDLVGELPIDFAGKREEYGLWVKSYCFHIPHKQTLLNNTDEVAQSFWVSESHLKNPTNSTLKNTVQSEPDALHECIQINDLYLWAFSLQQLKLSLTTIFQKVRHG